MKRSRTRRVCGDIRGDFTELVYIYRFYLSTAVTSFRYSVQHKRPCAKVSRLTIWLARVSFDDLFQKAN